MGVKFGFFTYHSFFPIDTLCPFSCMFYSRLCFVFISMYVLPMSVLLCPFPCMSYSCLYFSVHLYVCSAHVCAFLFISMHALPMPVFLCSSPCMLCPCLHFSVHFHPFSAHICGFLSVPIHILLIPVFLCPSLSMSCLLSPFLYFVLHVRHGGYEKNWKNPSFFVNSKAKAIIREKKVRNIVDIMMKFAFFHVF